MTCGLCTPCYGFSQVSYLSIYDKGIDDTARRSILSLKNGKPFFADIIGMGLSMVLENEIDDRALEQVLVSVPTHPDDHPERDYNPPDMLAQRIARFTGLPHVPNALIKTEPHSQKEYSTSMERFEEIQGKFDAAVNLDGKHVLLIDDLMTTGATASECARICIANGAMSVHVILAGRSFHFLEGREYG